LRYFSRERTWRPTILFGLSGIPLLLFRNTLPFPIAMTLRTFSGFRFLPGSTSLYFFFPSDKNFPPSPSPFRPNLLFFFFDCRFPFPFPGSFLSFRRFFLTPALLIRFFFSTALAGSVATPFVFPFWKGFFFFCLGSRISENSPPFFRFRFSPHRR